MIAHRTFYANKIRTHSLRLIRNQAEANLTNVLMKSQALPRDVAYTSSRFMTTTSEGVQNQIHIVLKHVQLSLSTVSTIAWRYMTESNNK
jgi:hypothetical protein